MIFCYQEEKMTFEIKDYFETPVILEPRVELYTVYDFMGKELPGLAIVLDMPIQGADEKEQFAILTKSFEEFIGLKNSACLHLSAATVKESRQSGNRRLSFVSHFFSLLVPPGQGNGRSRFQTCDPAQSGIFQTRSLRRLWRSHAPPGRCRGGSHAH